MILIIIPTRSDLEKDEKWRVCASFYHSKVLFESSKEILRTFFQDSSTQALKTLTLAQAAAPSVCQKADKTGQFEASFK